MLKPPGTPLPAGNERPIGELVTRLVDDGKAYAEAELDYAKALAAEKGSVAASAGILLGIALCLALGAIVALCVGIVMALAHVMGPLAAGVVTFVVIGIIAALIGWAGASKIKELW